MTEKIKQLQDQLEHASSVHEKVDTLTELSKEYTQNQPHEALSAANQALELAKTIDYKSGIAKALARLCRCYERFSNYEKALSLGLESLELFESIDDDNGKAGILSRLAWIYQTLGDYATALDHAMTSLELYRKINDPQGIFSAFNTLGSVSGNAGDPDKALEYYEEALQISRESNLRASEAVALVNIGTVYCRTFDDPEETKTKNELAIQYFEKSGVIFEEEKNLFNKNITIMNTGAAYLNLKKYPEALECFYHSLETAESLEQKSIQAHCLSNIAGVYSQQEKYDEACTYYFRALALAEDTKEKPRLAAIHQNLAEVFEKMEEFTKALEHFKKYHELNSEVFNENSDRKLKNLQVMHQVDQSKREADLLREKNEELAKLNQELEQTNEQLVKTQIQLMQAQAKRLENERMAALGGITNMVAHEMNNALNALKMPLEQLSNLPKLDSERIWHYWENDDDGIELQAYLAQRERELKTAADCVECAKNAELRMEQVIGGLRHLAGEKSQDLRSINIVEIFQEAVRLQWQYLEKLALIKEIEQPEMYLTATSGELGQIFLILISNACDALKNKPHPTITVKMHYKNDGIEILFQDNGSGIPSDIQQRIFDPFFTTKGEQNSGVGLSTLKRIITKYKGHLTVASEENEGTTFRIWLPLHTKASR